MSTKRNITCEVIYDQLMREPRKGELNHELKRILLEHCGTKPFKDAVKSVELAVNKLARRFGITEYNVTYDRNTNTRSERPWICENVDVVMYRRRPNRTLAIHRVGASGTPHFFSRPDGRYANLSAPRDITVYYGIDDPYDWKTKTCKTARPSLVARWRQRGMKKI